MWYFARRSFRRLFAVVARAKASAGWRCSDRTRAIFEACTSGGLSAAEVARAFGVSPGFVRIIRHRGRAREKKATHVA